VNIEEKNIPNTKRHLLIIKHTVINLHFNLENLYYIKKSPAISFFHILFTAILNCLETDVNEIEVYFPTSYQDF
jgi:hypothetical protein